MIKELGLAAVLLLGALGMLDPQPLAAQNPVPVVTVTSAGGGFIGDQTSFTLTFENQGNVAGFGPYVALCLPFLGADRDDLGKPCDGLSFVTAAASFDNGSVVLPPAGSAGVQLVLPAGATVSCPGTVASADNPLCSADFVLPPGSPGCQLVIVKLPFGSFYPDQPPIEIEITVAIHPFADPGVPLTVHAQGGFQYGTDPQGGQPCLEGPGAELDIRPGLFDLAKMVLAPEAETATGPNFPRKYAVAVDVADGQTVSALKVVDDLPDEVVYLGPYDNPPVVSAPPPGSKNGQLVLDFGTIQGGPGPDAGFEPEFYVADVDASGDPILEPGRCQEELTNPLSGTALWTPADPRDPSPQQHPSPVPVTATAMAKLTARCLAIQKGAPAIVEDGLYPGPTPGDVLEYRLDFQLSDYFQAGDLVVRDVLPDGLSFLAAFVPELRVMDKHGSTDAVFALAPAFEINSGARDICGDGSLELVFRVSEAMKAAAAPAVPLHAQGILTGGLATGTLPQAPGATGSIRYRARIDDRYHCRGSDQGVVKHDLLSNRLTIAAELLDPNNAQPLGAQADDDSHADVAIVSDVIRKTVYARNGDPNDPALAAVPPTFAPGDTVTFRITYTIPTTDAESVRVEDFLPSPVFQAAELASFPIRPCLGTAAPAAGEVCYLPTDTLTPFLNPLPGDVPPPPDACTPGASSYARPLSNSLCFDYGDLEDLHNEPRTLDVLVTLTLTGDPFVDGLELTNEVVEREQDSGGNPHQQVIIEQIKLGQPRVRVTKGVVAACCPQPGQCTPAGVFSPLPVAPAPFAPPGSSCLGQFPPPITSASLAATPITSDLLGGFEAGDLVRFALVVENVGSSPHGAFDVIVRDSLPPGFREPPGGVQLCIVDGVGNPLPFTVLPGGLFGSGIELDDPAPSTGALAPGKPASSAGTNLAILTYDLVVTPELAIGSCVENRAAVASYAGAEGGPDHVAAGVASNVEAEAEICLRPRFSKRLIATSEAHTAGAEVALGEVVRFRFELQVPAGTLPAVAIEDLLPPGLIFLDDGSARIALVSSSGTGLTASALSGPGLAQAGDETTAGSLVPTFPLPATGGPFGPGVAPVFRLGDLSNEDMDCNQELVIVELNALVANVPSNQQGTVLSDRARAWSARTQVAITAPVTVRVVEPTVTLTKTQPSDATYQLVLTHLGPPAAADAFDVEIFDLIPFARCLDTASVAITPAGGATGATASVTANTVRVRVQRMPPGSRVTVTFLAPGCRARTCFNSANRADVTYTSLPGPRGTVSNPTGSATPGASGKPDGERNGTGGVNEYLAGVELTDPGLDCAPELSLEKVLPAPLVPGQPAKYLLAVSNATGPEVIAATGPIVVTEPLPAGLTFVPTPGGYGPGWQCLATGGMPQTVTCTHPGPLQPGTSLTLGLTVDVAPGVAGPIENCASVSTPGDAGDPDDQACATGGGCSSGTFTYTTVADFEDGLTTTAQGPYSSAPLAKASDSSSSTVLPSGQLELPPPPLDPFPFVNVAASRLGTLVRIDANTGAVLGEFWTAPDGMGKDPSRTTVDQKGNVWVSNRNEAGGSPARGSVTRIGIVIGGTRVDALGNPDPGGDFIAPPWDYNTCEDRHGATIHDPADGLIRTSRGLGDVLAWDNGGGGAQIDSQGGVLTAEDECILNYVRTAPTNVRTVAIDENDDVWVGGMDMNHEKLSGQSGQPVAGSQFNAGCGGYGGLVNRDGVLWSAAYPGYQRLLRFDPGASPSGTRQCLEGDPPFTTNYGLALDPRTCRVWFSRWSRGDVCALEPDGILVGCYPHGYSYGQGLVVDHAGNVWVAQGLWQKEKTGQSATMVSRLRTDGTQMDPVPLELGGVWGESPTGVAVDVNGKVWVTNYDSHNVMRIDPNAGPPSTRVPGLQRGAVDLVVPLQANSFPYNYSDMTGFVSRNNPPNAFWTVTQDGQAAGTQWCKVCWNQESTGKGDHDIKVEVRAADRLNQGIWLEVANCQPLAELRGRYLEVRVSLTQKPEPDSGLRCEQASPDPPILTDITLQACCPCPPEATKAQVSGLHYPDLACPAATAAAENPLALGGFQYQLACERAAGGRVPDGVLAASVTSCRPAAGSGSSVDVELCCLPPPSPCPPDQTKALVTGLHYPSAASCAEAIQDAESESRLSSFHYRNACRQATGGDFAPAVLSAQVTSCEDAATSGVTLDAEVCCPDPVPMADLSLTKLHEGDAFVVGRQGQYQLIVSNLGPVPADSFTLTDALPANLAFVAASSSDWTCSATPALPPQTLTCNYQGPPLSAGASTQLALTVAVRSRPFVLQAKNCARVLPLDDPDPTNNESCDSVNVLWQLCEPDPWISTGSQALFRAGERGRLRLRITPRGDCPFQGPITVVTGYGPDLEFISGQGAGTSPGDEAWKCAQRVTLELACEHPGPLASGAATEIDLDFAVSSDAAPQTEICSQVQVPWRDGEITRTDCLSVDVQPAVETPSFRWKLKLFASYAADAASFAEGTGDERRTLEIGSGWGPGVALEFRPNQHLGFELGHHRPRLEISTGGFRSPSGVTLRQTLDRQLQVTTLGVNYHFAPLGELDLHAGLFLAHLELADPPSFATDFDLALGFALGLDIPLGTSRWCLTTQALYLDTDVGVSFPATGARIEVPFDLPLLSLGVAFRF